MPRAGPAPFIAARTNSHGVTSSHGNISSVNAHPNTMVNITNQVQRVLFTYPAQMTIKPMRMIVSDKIPRSPPSLASPITTPLSSIEAGGYIARTSSTSGGMTDTSAIVKSTLDTKTKSRRICKQHLPFNTHFHFAVLAWRRLYIQPLPLEAFLSFSLSRTTPAAQEGAQSGPSGHRRTRKCLISSSFSDTYPSTPFLRPVCVPAAAYPVATPSAPIRRTMLASSRRVRWLSASISQ